MTSKVIDQDIKSETPRDLLMLSFLRKWKRDLIPQNVIMSSTHKGKMLGLLLSSEKLSMNGFPPTELYELVPFFVRRLVQIRNLVQCQPPLQYTKVGIDNFNNIK